jgi:pyruvate kinase
MVDAGLGAARLNFSWGSYEDFTHYIETVRAVASERGVRIPIIQDLSGPRVQEKQGHEFNTHADRILTDKDLRDLDFGVEHKVEYVAQSYVGTADDVLLLRREIAKRGSNARIIAKVERQSALDHIDEIIEAADAIMIARGDLGNELPLEKIPYIELALIKRVRAAGKPVITATQMMLTMVDNPLPSRAEVTDVAYAVLHGSDATMLSEETARGKYPVEAVTMMHKVIVEAEKHGHRFDIRLL